jgi:tetratricopeptide (TPR) repeat protein
MTSAQALSALALRRLLQPAAGSVTDTRPAEQFGATGSHLARALRRANAKAWFALELLLVGRELLELLRLSGDRGTELQLPLRSLIEAAGPFPEERVRETLASLRSAAEAGLLTSGNLDLGPISLGADSTADLATVEAQTLAIVAEELERRGFSELRPLLALRAEPRDESLLVGLVAAIFRLAVEGEPDLFDDLEPLLKNDADAGIAEFRDLAGVLTREGAWLESLLEEIERESRNGPGTPLSPVPVSAPAPASDALVHLSRGEQHARRGEYDLAIAEFSAALRTDSDLAAAYAGRGDAMRLRGEYGPALADLDTSLRLAPGDPRALLTRGLTNALAGRHVEAIDDLTAVLERAPSAGAFNHRGTSRAALGDYPGAIGDFTDALRIDPSFPWAIYNRGEAYLAQREYMAAVADFSNVLRLNPLFTLGHVRRGDAYLRNGELNRAIADYSSALRLDPHNVPAFVSRGTAYKKKERYEKALADFDAGVELDADNPNAYFQRGVTYRLKNQPDLALADFDLAARLAPGDPEVLYQRGLTHDSLGHRADALADLTRTIELAPEHVAAFNSRGTLHLAAGNHAEAEADFSEALRLDPNFALAYLNRATVRSKTGKPEESIADCDEAIQRHPGLTAAYLVRGSVYAQSERYEPAIANFSEVLRRDAENNQAFYLRGVARSKLGDYSGARADLSRALRLDPANARAYAFRGLSHQALKRSESAVIDFANAVRLDAKYAAAYCNQRAALHSDRGEYELAVADYSLLLVLDPDNHDAKAARDRALRAILSRPAAASDSDAEPGIAQLHPTKEVEAERTPAPPAVSASPPSRPKPRRPATATAIMPKAPETESSVAVALPEAAQPPEAESEDSEPDFVLGPAPESQTEEAVAQDTESDSVSRPTAAAARRLRGKVATSGDSSTELELIEPDSEEELSRQEELEAERRAAEAHAEQEARLRKLAAERQRMLEEVKRQKEDSSRARRVQKRRQSREYDEEGFPWLQWGVRAGVAAMVLWSCFWVYDFFLGQTISRPSCYPLHGSVKFADGRPVSGGVLLLIQGSDEHEADIGADGSFQTKTFSNKDFDGLPAGEYKVFLAPSSLSHEPVPPKYLRGGETPWVVKVKRQDNLVDLVVQ